VQSYLMMVQKVCIAVGSLTFRVWSDNNKLRSWAVVTSQAGLFTISPRKASHHKKKKAGYSVEHCPLNLIIATKRTTSSDQLPNSLSHGLRIWSRAKTEI
jgi:hypothetical protein